MIKKIISKIFKPSDKKKLLVNKIKAQYIIPATKHKIDPNLVSANAQTVVSKLQQAGFQAFIVGGAVRDLLLNLAPKDFDVATNATPEQIKACFRRAFIIGKRFRLVHVVFGQGRQDRGLSEIIEVSTFRALYQVDDAQKIKNSDKVGRKDLQNIKLAVDSKGRILRDNVWGSQQEDAARRDFTLNAMYYDPNSGNLVDYHHGYQDIQNRVIRIIGDAATRYREDPVRVLRALRFIAKLEHLGFSLEENTKAQINQTKQLLINVPQSRLFDETLKLLQGGHSQASLRQILKLKLHQNSYPLLELVGASANQAIFQVALSDSDKRVKVGKSLAASFIIAVLLWQPLQRQWQKNLTLNPLPFAALLDAIGQIFDQHIGDVSGRSRLASDMRELWLMQLRLEARATRSVRSLVQQPRFRAGFDFFILRAKAGEVDQVLVAWWDAYIKADSIKRDDMLQQLRLQQPTKKRRKRKKKTVAIAQQDHGNLTKLNSKKPQSNEKVKAIINNE